MGSLCRILRIGAFTEAILSLVENSRSCEVVNLKTPDLYRYESVEFMHAPVVATLNGSPVPGLGPDLCHDRGLALPHPTCGVRMPVAHGVPSVIVPGWRCGHCQWISLRPELESSVSGLEGQSTLDSGYPQLA